MTCCVEGAGGCYEFSSGMFPLWGSQALGWAAAGSRGSVLLQKGDYETKCSLPLLCFYSQTLLSFTGAMTHGIVEPQNNRMLWV